MTKKEAGRQVFHLLTGILIVICLQMKGVKNTSELLFILLITGLILSYTSKKIKMPVINQLLTRFDRKEDLNRFPGRGAITFILGCLLAVLLFDINIASASIIILAVLDSFSTMFGLRFGKVNHVLHHKTTLEGSMFGFAASFFAVLIFVNPLKAILACFMATLIEMIDFRVDDNILIPVVSGIILMIPI